MEEMAAGTQNQSQDIQSGTRQIEEMNNAMLDIDKGPAKPWPSPKMLREASNRQAQAKAAVEGMDHIKTSVDSLGAQTEEIATILGFIQEIAEQTRPSWP